MDFQKYLNDSFKLGEGAFGKVYRVKLGNWKWCALKLQHQDNFEDSFHLLSDVKKNGTFLDSDFSAPHSDSRISDRYSSDSFAWYLSVVFEWFFEN